MGLLERLRQADVPEETLEEKTAHEAWKKSRTGLAKSLPSGLFSLQ